MKSDYRSRAAKFLRMIYPYIANCRELEDYQDAVERFNEEKSRHVFVEHGISRIVLITSDYVIKMDYGDYFSYGTCEDEYRFYNFAVKNNKGYLFAEITRKEINGHMFYIMPRVKGIGKTEEYVQEYLDEDDIDFVNEYLEDLHNENYGWKNNYPIIIDYACNVFISKRSLSDFSDE